MMSVALGLQYVGQSRWVGATLAHSWLLTLMHGSTKSPKEFVTARLTQGASHIQSAELTENNALRLIFNVPGLHTVPDVRNWVLQRLGTALVDAWSSGAGTFENGNAVAKLVAYDLVASMSYGGATMTMIEEAEPTPLALAAAGVDGSPFPWAHAS